MLPYTSSSKSFLLVVLVAHAVNGWTTISKCTQQPYKSYPSTTITTTATSSSLSMGLFDGNFKGFGSGNSQERLDEQWELQQAILAERRKPKSERDKVFKQIEDRRRSASKKQNDMWSWQTKTYAKGEDPITEWKKRRADGSISDLDNQYGDPKKIGGIPLPSASFGVGGEFGVGGKFDNGGRFDLRLPYADQGYVDEDSDVMGKIGNMFSFGSNKKPSTTTTPVSEKNNKSKKSTTTKPSTTATTPPPKKNGWPW